MQDVLKTLEGIYANTKQPGDKIIESLHKKGIEPTPLQILHEELIHAEREWAKRIKTIKESHLFPEVETNAFDNYQ